MAKPPTYARWLYNLAITRKEVNDLAFEGCEEVLAFIAVRESDGKPTKVTDIVQSLLFGTGPTVHRKVLLLIERGLISAKPNKDDARAKLLATTKAGISLLSERSKQMAQFVAGKDT